MTNQRESKDRRAPQEFLYPLLVRLIQSIDESAAIAYPRALHRRHLTRLLVFLIGLSGAMTSRELVNATGYEKAQISREIKGLAESGLIDRPGLRGSIRLTPAGEALFAQIMVVARQRDARLRAGLDEEAMRRFMTLTARLIARASQLLVEDDSAEPAEPAPRMILSKPSVHDLMLPALRSLMVRIRRNGASLFQRELGLATLEWRILSWVGEHAPLSLSGLIPLAARDKSQVGRAVKQLNAAGLLRRCDEGRINVVLELTPAGSECLTRIHALGVRHDESFFCGFAPQERELYLDVLERIGANAEALLAEEKALQTSRAGEEAAAIAEAAELERLRGENEQLKARLADALRAVAQTDAARE